MWHEPYVLGLVFADDPPCRVTWVRTSLRYTVAEFMAWPEIRMCGGHTDAPAGALLRDLPGRRLVIHDARIPCWVGRVVCVPGLDSHSRTLDGLVRVWAQADDIRAERARIEDLGDASRMALDAFLTADLYSLQDQAQELAQSCRNSPVRTVADDLLHLIRHGRRPSGPPLPQSVVALLD
jgi:hypothetical protein